MIDQTLLNGTPPDFRNKECTEIVVMEYWYVGKLDEEGNVIHLKVDDQWHRLYFDYGNIFWRTEKDEEVEFINSSTEVGEYKFRHILKEIKIIKNYEMIEVKGGSKIELNFTDQERIIFECINDNTKIHRTNGSN